MDSQPLDHQGSPKLYLNNNKTYIEMKTNQKTRAVTGMAGRLGSAGNLMGRPTRDLRVARLLFFFFNLFIYFNRRLITLQYCSCSHHTLTWISHGCTCIPHPEPPSHLPPHSLPQGCPSAPALSALSCRLLKSQFKALRKSVPGDEGRSCKTSYEALRISECHFLWIGQVNHQVNRDSREIM